MLFNESTIMLFSIKCYQRGPFFEVDKTFKFKVAYLTFLAELLLS